MEAKVTVTSLALERRPLAEHSGKPGITAGMARMANKYTIRTHCLQRDSGSKLDFAHAVAFAEEKP